MELRRMTLEQAVATIHANNANRHRNAELLEAVRRVVADGGVHVTKDTLAIALRFLLDEVDYGC